MSDSSKQQASNGKPWHNMEAKEVMEELGVSPDKGLADEEVSSRQKKYGVNKLPQAKKQGWLMRLLSQFNNILIYLLLAAAVITGFMGEWVETFVILAVVLINVLISFIQEGRAEKALEGIKQMLSLEARVIRNSEEVTVEAEKLVPGDIVLLNSGDKIPADLRIIESNDLRVEESALTGESEEVDKQSDTVDEDAVIGDRSSMGFSGTTVTFGQAKGVLVATGKDTEIGKITGMISEVDETRTPLMKKIDGFGKVLSVIIVVMASGFFAVAYFLQDFSLHEAFMAAISIIVASIPEGLPAIMTITLAIGVQRMAKRHAIIRKLPAVETLGAVSVICSDKTGTLTRNEMTAKDIITSNNKYQVEGSGYAPKGKILTEKEEKADVSKDPVLEKMLWSMRLCNDSKLKEENDDWKLDGTPTEGALLTLSYKAGMEELESDRIDSLPFASERKYMASLNTIDDKTFIFVNGAPERLLELCQKQYKGDDVESIDKEFWEEQMNKMAEQGQRVLGLACKEVKSGQDNLEEKHLEEDLIFLGCTGIIDPPREGVIESIRECKDAGIRPVMITGDHAVTAAAIARELEIEKEQEAITGKQLEEMEGEKMQEVVKKHNVFARTNPEHKLKIVQALQEDKLLCAMTGDGVNDAPALKKADIGISMGIKGTEVSKESSEMVLADDNFSSIVNAIEEGRTVYDNLKKTILFLLPANGAEALVLIAAIVLGTTLPISPVQILWINMVSAVTLALALSVEPMETKVMKRPPRDPEKPILGGYFAWRVAFVSMLTGGLTYLAFNMMYNAGEESLDMARTLAVNTLVGGHVFYLLTCRKLHQSSFSRSFFDNPYVFLAIAILVGLQLIFTYVPLMNSLFGTYPLALTMWIYPLIAGITVFILVELEKFITGKMGAKS